MNPTAFPVLALALQLSLGALGLSMLLCLWRMWRGPTLPDRIMALDTLYLYGLSVIIVLGIRQNSSTFFEVALLIALLGFLSTIAAARYLVRRRVIE